MKSSLLKKRPISNNQPNATKEPIFLGSSHSSLTALIVSDLHFTDSQYDEYKWELFPWIHNKLDNGRVSIPNLFILGDLFDKKDRHPSGLVNRFITNLKQLNDRNDIENIIILKGNHDYIKPNEPYLEFLQTLDKVIFIKDPTYITIEDEKTLWLPHTRYPEKEWEHLDFADPSLRYVFFHQSVIGCVVSNLFEMKEGLNKSIFEGAKANLISGDIHVPQRIEIKNTRDGMYYVGTPYPVAFGDTYIPRGLLIHNDRIIELPRSDSIKKVKLYITNKNELEDSGLKENDQVKIVLVLPQEELADWDSKKKAIQEYCAKEGIILRDIRLEKEKPKDDQVPIDEVKDLTNLAPQQILKEFAALNQLDEETLKTGLEFMK